MWPNLQKPWSVGVAGSERNLARHGICVRVGLTGISTPNRLSLTWASIHSKKKLTWVCRRKPKLCTASAYAHPCLRSPTTAKDRARCCSASLLCFLETEQANACYSVFLAFCRWHALAPSTRAACSWRASHLYWAIEQAPAHVERRELVRPGAVAPWRVVGGLDALLSQLPSQERHYQHLLFCLCLPLPPAFRDFSTLAKGTTDRPLLIQESSHPRSSSLVTCVFRPIIRDLSPMRMREGMIPLWMHAFPVWKTSAGPA